MEDLTEPKSLGSIAPLGPPLKAMGKPPPMPIGPKECGPAAPLVGGGGCDVSTGLITRCTVLPSVTSAKQYKGWRQLAHPKIFYVCGGRAVLWAHASSRCNVSACVKGSTPRNHWILQYAIMLSDIVLNGHLV